MYKDEVEKLKRHKQTYEHIEIPHDLIDEQIQLGLQKGKNEEKQPFRINWLLATALLAVVLVGFVSTKQIIDYVRDNKGLMSAIEHDYYEEMGISTKNKNIEFIVDGVIADKKGIVVFYTIHSDERRENIDVKAFHFSDKEDKEIKLSFASYGGDLFNDKKRNSFSGVIEGFYKNDNMLTDFNLTVEVEERLTDGTFQNEGNQTFTIPLKIEKGISASKVYELDETVTIEGQKIRFQSATVSPIRTEIQVQMDRNNTKKILQFEDLRIVDEHGETWGKINNGITATSRSDDEQTIYLQSNYFKDPKELFIELNKIQAIDKEDSKVIVDPVEEKIIKQPKGNMLKKFRVEASYLVFEMADDQENAHNTFGFHTMYQDDEEISYSSNYFRKKENSIEVGVGVDRLDHLNERISLEISHYPIWITGSERVRVK